MSTAVSSYSCPKCNAENTASVPVVYARETGTKVFAGVGIDGSGEVGVFGGGAKSATGFADKIAPRLERRRSGLWSKLGIIFAIGCVVALLLYFTQGRSDRRSERDKAAALLPVAAVLAVAACVGIAVGRISREANHEIDRRNSAVLQRWETQWVCLRCGNQWEPNAGSAQKNIAGITPTKQRPKPPKGWVGSTSLNYDPEKL